MSDATPGDHSSDNAQLPHAPTEPVPPKKKRGLALASEETRAAVSRKGAARLHELGKAHRWDKDGAREAGRKGGSAPRTKKKRRSYGRLAKRKQPRPEPGPAGPQETPPEGAA